MFINDIYKEFYGGLIGQQVLLLVNCDTDALCAARILQALFCNDCVLYTLIPVQGWEDVKKAFKENILKVKTVIMLNCGGTKDVVDDLDPPADVKIFISDSHKPTDIANIYRDEQIYLLTDGKDEEDIPQFEDIFKDESSDEEDEGGGREAAERMLERRRERRLWEEKRNRIMFDYSQFTYYGSSVAVSMYEMAWKMSKDTNDLLWWAICGLTDQYLCGKIVQQKYVLDCGSLQNHVSRLNHKDADSENADIRITYDKELQLALYRHWSLMESFKLSPYTCCKFSLWTLRGERKFHELLAELGLPLSQCKQKWTSMDMHVRADVGNMLESKSEKYHLQDILYGSFILQLGIRHKFSAADFVFSANALLESVEKDKSASDKFLDALDSVSRHNVSVLTGGISLAKLQLGAIFKQVQALLDMSQVISMGPFLYANITQSSDARWFSYPGCLQQLGSFLLRAHSAANTKKRKKHQPLVLSAPKPDDTECLIIGLPPHHDDSCKNLFGKAFEQAVEKTGSNAAQDYFDTSVMTIKLEDRTKFLDALISLLN